MNEERPNREKRREERERETLLDQKKFQSRLFRVFAFLATFFRWFEIFLNASKTGTRQRFVHITRDEERRQRILRSEIRIPRLFAMRNNTERDDEKEEEEEEEKEEENKVEEDKEEEEEDAAVLFSPMMMIFNPCLPR